jgi:hypothetical protein
MLMLAVVSNPTAADGTQLHNPRPALRNAHNLPLFIFEIEMFSSTYLLCILFMCPRCAVMSSIYNDRGTSLPTRFTFSVLNSGLR